MSTSAATTSKQTFVFGGDTQYVPRHQYAKPPPAASSADRSTRLLLEELMDRASFQALCDELLSAHFGYEVRPRGMSARGTVRGQPDSWGYDSQGRLCAFEYGTSRDWRAKLDEDQAHVSALSVDGFNPATFVFCTNRHVDPTLERSAQAHARSRYGWDLRIIGQGDLAIPLDTTWQDVRARHLRQRITRHNWLSLCDVCARHRRATLARYLGKYEPDLYVHRNAERTIETWYRAAVDEMAKGRISRQLFVLVDEAGAGKSNLVLHLAEELGATAPTLVFPGDLVWTDENALERAIVTAVEYPTEGRTFQADLEELLRLAQQGGAPILVVLDGINESRDPSRIRSAVTHLLTMYQGRPLLVLMTCRDTLWTLVQDPAWHPFSYRSRHRLQDEIAESLGRFDEKEFVDARKRYFAARTISAALGPEAAAVLHSPLLLRVFADAYAGSDLGYVLTAAAEPLWTTYLERKLDDVWNALGRRLRLEAIQEALTQVAMRMLDRDVVVLERRELVGIPHLDIDDSSPASLLVRLHDASLLLEHPPGTARFVHEAFREFITGLAIAQRLNTGDTDQREQTLARLRALATDARWQQVPVHATGAASDPSEVVRTISGVSLWIAARALLVAGPRVSIDVRHSVVADLRAQLSSRYALDRRRAAALLGRLGVVDAVPDLINLLDANQSAVAIRALARLGSSQGIDPLIRHLGRDPEWHHAEDHELVAELTPEFRGKLETRALELLSSHTDAPSATVTLGHLRSTAAVSPLMSRLAETDWCDGPALISLLRIGTPDALAALETAMGEAGKRARAHARTAKEARTSGASDSVADPEQRINDHYWALEELRVFGFQHSPPAEVEPFLTKLLQHPNFDVRLTAIQSLAQLGIVTAAPSIVRSADLAKDEFGTSMAIGNALREFSQRLDVTPFLALLEEPDTPVAVQRFCLEGLGLSRDARVLPVLRQLVLRRQHLFQAVQAIGRLGHSGGVALLTPLLDARDVRARDRYIVQIELGRLGHGAAFEPLVNAVRRSSRELPMSTIAALATTGRENAIQPLRDLWERRPASRPAILDALVWIGTDRSTQSILDLLAPHNTASVALLVKALDQSAMRWVGAQPFAPIDGRLVDLIALAYDQLPADVQRAVLWRFQEGHTPAGVRLIERVAADQRYDAVEFNSPGSEKVQTLRAYAYHAAIRAGSPVAIDFVLDDMVESGGAAYAALHLSGLNRPAVIAALEKRLVAGDVPRAMVLQLLGWFGDTTVLPRIRYFLDDPDGAIADAAYEAEQRLLGIADGEWSS